MILENNDLNVFQLFILFKSYVQNLDDNSDDNEALEFGSDGYGDSASDADEDVTIKTALYFCFYLFYIAEQPNRWRASRRSR